MSVNFPIEADLSAADKERLDFIQSLNSTVWTTKQTAFYNARSNYLNNRIIETDTDGNILRCSGYAVPSSALSGFAKGCIFLLRNAAGGTSGFYQNIGTSTSCTFALNSGSGGNLFVTVATDGSGTFNCDGTADEVEINAAITSVNAAGGGIVHIKPGTYITAGTVTMASNIILEGEGEASLIMFPVNGTQLDCRNIANYKLRNFKLDSSSQSGSTSTHGIRQYGVSNSEVSGLHIETHAFGIFTATLDGENVTTDVWIHHNYIHGACNNDLIGGGPNTDISPDLSNVIVQDNLLCQDANMSGAGTYTTAMDITGVKRVLFRDNVTYGSIVFGNERDPNETSSIIGNNVFPALNTNTVAASIEAQDDVNTGDIQSKLILANNYVYGGWIKVTGTTGQHSQNVIIENNIVFNNPAFTTGGPTTIAQNGVYLRYADNCIVSGNRLVGNSSTTSGLKLFEGVNNLLVNNKLDGYTNGFDESGTTSGNCYIGNHVTNTTNTVLSGTLAAAATISNNYGINPECCLSAQGNITGATTFDRLNGDVITGTLTGNITVTLNTTRAPRGSKLTLVLTQDGTGSRTVTWPSNFKKAGGSLTLSTGASAVDIIRMVYDGTNWREVSRALNQS